MQNFAPYENFPLYGTRIVSDFNILIYIIMDDYTLHHFLSISLDEQRSICKNG